MIVRADGRPTYNFASPVEDMLDGITHVIRGQDHVSNTPTQINILTRSVRSCRSTRTPPTCSATTAGSCRSATAPCRSTRSVRIGYIREALMNFLALLGWSYDDKTTVMTPSELIERFSLERVGASPATFDYEKLAWLNGVHLRMLSERGVRRPAARMAARAGIDWPEERVRATVPLVLVKLEKLSQYPDYVRFLFETVSLTAMGAPTVPIRP